MYPPNLVEIFTSVCNRDNGALKWGNPEPWVHAELFAEFEAQAQNSGWIPFTTEVPYVTLYPVQMPKPSNRDWKSIGAVKWVDLCLISEETEEPKEWCWFEFKVRHAGLSQRADKAAMEARDAFRKDIVALLGLDVNATADIWENPDCFTAAYWFKEILEPHIANLRPGNHHFICAFLQLGGEFNKAIWNREDILRQVNSWKAHRCRQRGEEFFESGNLKVSSSPIGDHQLVVVEW